STRARPCAVPSARCVCTGASTAPQPGYNPARRPGDRGVFRDVEESPDTAGQDAPDREAAKADGKWHRKQTAGRGSPESRPVRVKRWGKSPPAALATGPARQTPSGARRTGSADAARRGAG